MPNTFDASGRALPNTRVKRIAASATTAAANLSVIGDTARGDYISHVIITNPSTAAGGAAGSVTLLDGDTAIFVHALNATLATELAQTIVVDVISNTTKGFNIITGSSASAVVVGRY